MIYQGAIEELIQQAGDTYTVDPNGLKTLVRTFSCASTYATAAASLLNLEASASNYNGMTLFTKTRSDADGITRFTCTYHGVDPLNNLQKVSTSILVRSFDYKGFHDNQLINLTGGYYSPTYTVEKTVAAGDDSITAPTISTITGGTLVRFTKIVSNYYTMSDLEAIRALLAFEVTPISINRVNYGTVDLLTKVFTLTSPYG
jgi:hypothetical protein